jgi:hypothetical protein
MDNRRRSRGEVSHGVRLEVLGWVAMLEQVVLTIIEVENVVVLSFLSATNWGFTLVRPSYRKLKSVRVSQGYNLYGVALREICCSDTIKTILRHITSFVLVNRINSIVPPIEGCVV